MSVEVRRRGREGLELEGVRKERWTRVRTFGTGVGDACAFWMLASW